MWGDDGPGGSLEIWMGGDCSWVLLCACGDVLGPVVAERGFVFSICRSIVRLCNHCVNSSVSVDVGSGAVVRVSSEVGVSLGRTLARGVKGVPLGEFWVSGPVVTWWEGVGVT